MDVLSDLLGEQISQLGPYLVLGIEFDSQLVRIVTFADQDVLVATFSDLNSQSQYLFPLVRRRLHLRLRLGPSRGGSARRRTLVVLALQLNWIGRQAREVVRLDVVQVARQAQRLEELLLMTERAVGYLLEI